MPLFLHPTWRLVSCFFGSLGLEGAGLGLGIGTAGLGLGLEGAGLGLGTLVLTTRLATDASLCM